MKEKQIKQLEEMLGCKLPIDYRNFLKNHNNSLLDNDLIFKSPNNGIISELLTIDQILENSQNNRIGIPEESLMHIGNNLMDGYLYMKLSDNGFGEIYYMNNYSISITFSSFKDFMNNCITKNK